MQPGEWLEVAFETDLLAFVREDAKRAVSAICSEHPERARLLTEHAREDMQAAYRMRVGALYASATFEDVVREAQREGLVGRHGIDDVRRDDVSRAIGRVLCAMNENPDVYYRESMPLLAEQEERIRSNFVESQAELLDRVLCYRNSISKQFYGGAPITRIESFVGIGEDVHRRGRSVTGIRTDAGTFYYKPRDCRIDMTYRQMVERWFSDFTVAADCVVGDGCGFVAQLVKAPLSDEGELHDYYANLGRLTALFCGIGGTDMHCENILPVGVKPAAVDLETMLAGMPRRRAKTGRILRSADWEVLAPQTNVDKSAILPHYLPHGGVVSPLYESAVQAQGHMPVVRGDRFSVEGFEDDYLRGFKDGYARMTGVREEVGALLSSCTGGVTRVVPYNSAFYQYVLMYLYRRKSLSSPEGQERALRKLRVPYEAGGYDVDETMVRYEAGCLLEGDIPYYCTTLDGTALCGASPDEVLHLDYFSASAKDRAMRILDGLSEPRCRQETDVIRNSLAQVALPAPKEGPEPLPGHQPEPGQIRSLVSELNEGIERFAIRSADGGMVWRSTAASMRGERSCGLPSDVADVGRYVADVLASGMFPAKHTRLMRLLGNCAQGIHRWVSVLAEEKGSYLRLAYPLGPAQGLDGILRGCNAMAAVDSPGAEEVYHDLLGMLSNKRLLVVEDPKQLEGAAWLVLALCDCEVPDERIVPLVCDGAQSVARLASALFQEDPTKCAAVGAALANASDVLGRNDFAAPALAAFKRVCSTYVKRCEGWPDESGSLRWLAPRGTAAAWIGTCALTARRHVAGGELRRRVDEALRLALGSLMREDFLWHGDQLLYGNAMAVECLLGAASELGEKRYCLRAGQILAGMLLRKGRTGAFCTNPRGLRSYFDVSYMRGSLGIGACALDWQRGVTG